MTPRARREAGFSYAEVLVATVLIALVLAPALEGLTAAVLGARIHLTTTEEDFHLRSLVEEVLAQPFDVLDAEAVSVADPTLPTAFSDPPGSPRRRLVYLARYDGDDADGDADPFTGGDDGLLWVRVTLENTHRELAVLTAR